MNFKLIVLNLMLGITASLQAETITLTQTNSVSLVDVVSEKSVASVILGIEKLTDQKIYLYINSPGGSVIDGLVLVDYLHTSGKDITCIAKYAASMAHAILEACPTRAATPDNRLMQHRMSAGAEGSPDDIAGQANTMKGLELYLDTMEAERIGISLTKFQLKAAKPWYTFGNQSLKENLIDRIASLTCDPKLYTISTEEVKATIFGQVKIVRNGCPLIPVVVLSSDER